MLQSAPPHLRHFIVHLENTMWCTSTPKDRRSLHGCRRCLGKELLLPSMALIGSARNGNQDLVLAKGDDRILFTGFVQGAMLEELYSNAYIYTLPSDLEGMPLSLLEAMSYGNCCLVSDIPECAEVVEDNGTSKSGHTLHCFVRWIS